MVKLPLAEFVITQPQTKISPPHMGFLGFPRAESESEQVNTPDRGVQSMEARGSTEMKNYVEYKADKTTFLCHIEYILAPEVQPKSVDIICWERVAKIYVEEDSAAIIPLACDKIFWIYFRVEHVITINNEHINDYYNHNILLTVSLDGKKFGQAAKSEKVKVFYGPRHEPCELFPSLCENPQDIASSRIKMTNSKRVLRTDFESNELSNKLKTVMQDLTKEYDTGNKKPVATGQGHPPWKTVKTKQEDGNPAIKTSKSWNKEDLKSEISFAITGESILSGLKVIENYVKYKSEELPFVYSAVQVKNVLDPELAKHYNPLSITLKRLNFMPVSALHKEHINKVRFCYTVCEDYEAQSNDIGISENMILNYTRTILTDRISINELIEYIQTKGLTITLLGIREEGGDEMKKVKPKIYKDQRINCKSGFPGLSPKDKPLDKAGPVILGVVKIDISSLLLDPHQLNVKYNFNCSEFDHGPLSKTEFYSTINPTEVNNIGYDKSCDRLCHELISSHAILTVSVRLSFSLKNHLETMKCLPHIRNRIFIVTNDVTTAVKILKTIQSHQEILAPTDYSKSAGDFNRSNFMQTIDGAQRNSELNMLGLTGFLIDCVDHFLIYVDAPIYGVLQNIWSTASSIQPSKGRVLYDSSLVFNRVSYEDLIRFGGFYIISLRQAPEVLMSNKDTYKKGNIPTPAFKALIQLYHLTRCLSITRAFQHNLFPSFSSLLSLDLEFGVPHMFT